MEACFNFDIYPPIICFALDGEAIQRDWFINDLIFRFAKKKTSRIDSFDTE